MACLTQDGRTKSVDGVMRVAGHHPPAFAAVVAAGAYAFYENTTEKGKIDKKVAEECGKTACFAVSYSLAFIFIIHIQIHT